MITREQAFAAYLQLEGPRTLERLRQNLIDDGADAPSLHWFQKWCGKDRWRDRAKEHDRQVELRTSEMIVSAKAETRIELSEQAEKAAAVGFVALAEILATWRPTKAEDIERMAAIPLTALGGRLAGLVGAGRSGHSSLFALPPCRRTMGCHETNSSGANLVRRSAHNGLRRANSC